mmetsp:Transcript_49673/g.154189  ORF Transcript_49673/g.154189 Transcript_49673/m.154189 type:complete len:286 (+) Transcript_49673:74-931(+)
MPRFAPSHRAGAAAPGLPLTRRPMHHRRRERERRSRSPRRSRSRSLSRSRPPRSRSSRSFPRSPPPPPPPPLPQVPAGLTRNGRPVAAWTDADWEELAVASEKMSVEQRFDLAQALGRDGRERLGKLTARREEQRRGEEEQRREEEEAAAAAREQASRGAASELLSKLTFERLKEMSNEERFEVAKEVGPAYAVSLALVALCYWALNIPFLAYAYHESTGLWPDLGSLDSLDSLQAAGTFASIFAAYALLKPVRLFVALLVTPWTVENVMPALTRLGSTGDGEGK